MHNTPTRLCEWGRVPVNPGEWPPSLRRALLDASEAWRATHRLNALPLEWGGIDGCTLRARQWVGVLEVEDAAGARGRVEIYPKLDAALLQKDKPSDEEAQVVLHSLLAMLDAGGYGEWVETDRAALSVAPLQFPDVWAYLLGKHLWPELQRGLARFYVAHEDDLPSVRGRIQMSRQVTRNWDRFDRIACVWDEFTPDVPLLRLLKCACRVLRRLASHPVALGKLGDCLGALEGVSDETAGQVLRETERLTWTRATERFRPSFELARRVLQELGPQLGAGRERTWTFLVDMNRVFEAFCRAAIEARWSVAVQEQQFMGTLLQLSKGGLHQKADFRWQRDGRVWIGDAKWKFLARGDEAWQFAGAEEQKGLSPDDVRQLSTYAGLETRRSGAIRPQLAIFYPFIGTGRPTVAHAQTWNGSTLQMIPTRVQGWKSLADVLAG